MPPKRPSGEELNGRQRKKLKTQAARDINVQRSDKGSQKVTIDAAKGLPSAIDVEKFVEARGYEIQAMEKAMKSAGEASTHRVWQSLPRHLRRRAASHDVRRVPKRLWDRAKAEMDPPKAKKGKKPPKKGKEKRETKTASFERRQRDKTWLESHIWHAKRMHMENMWGFRIAIKTTEKAFRPSFRAATRGCILHDASYIGTIQLKGKASHLKGLLDICCDPQTSSPGSIRYSSGSRALETHIYRPNKYPYDLVAPVTILWQPTESSQDDARYIWIRVHPGAFDVVFKLLTEASSIVMSEGEPEAEVELSDMRGHLNEFEVMGPASGPVVCKALSMVMSTETRKEAFQFWCNLKMDGSSSASPRGLIAGFVVHDPRIKTGQENSKLAANVPSFVKPNSTLATSKIWSQEKRLELANPVYSKADIDKRRGQASTRGQELHPGPEDARIPILLVQKSLAPTSADQSVHGWSLIFPRGWSMAFLSALTYSSIRVAGLRDCQTQALESGVPHFPNDYPGTALYDAYARERGQTERSRWERTPPAKRVTLLEPGNLDPWIPKWRTGSGSRGSTNADEHVMPTQRDEEDESTAGPSGWIFRTSLSATSIRELAISEEPQALMLSWVNTMRSARGMDECDVDAQSLYDSTLVPVEIVAMARGVPQDSSRIYILSDAECSNFQKSLPATGGSVQLVPEENDTILPVGYITTGAYSLSRGKGIGIGCISLTSAVHLEQQRQRLEASEILACFRNKTETTHWGGRISFL